MLTILFPLSNLWSRSTKLISCIKSCDFCNKRNFCMYPFIWNNGFFWQSNHMCIYMELLWTSNVDKNGCPATHHGSSRPISHLQWSQKISHLHLKRQNIHFLKHKWWWQRTFGNSSSALHHIPGANANLPKKDFLNGLFVSQTTMAAKPLEKPDEFLLATWKMIKAEGLTWIAIDGGWDLKSINPMLQQPKNK